LRTKKEHKSNAKSKTPEFYVKNPNLKKLRSVTQIHHIIREITEEEKRTSQPLYIYNDIYTLTSTLNPNDAASPFIKKN